MEKLAAAEVEGNRGSAEPRKLPLGVASNQ